MFEDIVLIEKPITKSELNEIAQKRFGDMVKGVVDLKKEIMVLGGDLHADEESYLLEHGSSQSDLWGINLYPDLEMPDMLEFDSMINIRPQQNNRSRSIEDASIQKKVIEVVNKLIEKQ